VKKQRKNHQKKSHYPGYDAVLKDLFQQDHPSLLDRLTGGARFGSP